MSGLTEESMSASGKTMSCTVRAPTNGPMAECTTVNTRTIRRMALVSMSGLMGELT